MKDILSDIVRHKREELLSVERSFSYGSLVSKLACEPLKKTVSMKKTLLSSSTGIIAEFKRKSPSKGWINPDADPVSTALSYEKGGAVALSVLTDSEYFGGSLDYLKRISHAVSIPVLRKEFILGKYQLAEARLAGADAVLLIASCLELPMCEDLIGEAHRLGLETLLEVHSPDESGYARCGSDMIGVNNRNLGTFVTDTGNSFRMAETLRNILPDLSSGKGPVLISESGISDPSTIDLLRKAGFKGFLMGERFMKNVDPGNSLEKFIKTL
ncbi:MAG: indole-3-glycerol phosphate synthase TrpC [Bacteroidales bacterium]|jgi:indole-3-glycerol phosphate synthase|nr:indole-3-glycerol phosphate synthase TrpC [Bacteroidales bacterium]MCI1785916.1 indole-3-glycerol phosphate synthase TrpC [Bacteroidales bacterium]